MMEISPDHPSKDLLSEALPSHLLFTWGPQHAQATLYRCSGALAGCSCDQRASAIEHICH